MWSDLTWAGRYWCDSEFFEGLVVLFGLKKVKGIEILLILPLLLNLGGWE